MQDVTEKARKYVGIWVEDARVLKALSQSTGRSQVALIHAAILLLAAATVPDRKEAQDAR
jgi:hypothetical protein